MRLITITLSAALTVGIASADLLTDETMSGSSPTAYNWNSPAAGNTGAWLQYNSSPTFSSAGGGTYMEITNMPATFAGGQLRQLINNPGAGDYEMTIVYRASEAPNNAFFPQNVGAGFYQSADNLPNLNDRGPLQLLDTTWADTAGAWTTNTYNFSITAGQATNTYLGVEFTFQHNNSATGAEYINVDSFSLTSAIPEPGTAGLALMAGSLLMFLRRRRK